jgi:hypothetical protein
MNKAMAVWRWVTALTVRTGRGFGRSRSLVWSVAASVVVIASYSVATSQVSVSGTYTWIEPTPTQNGFTASNSPQYTSYAESKGSIMHNGGSTPTTGIGAAYTRLEFSGQINGGLDPDKARWEVHFYRGEMVLKTEAVNHYPDIDTTYRVEAWGKLRYRSHPNQYIGSAPFEHEAKKLLELIPEQTLKTWPELYSNGDPEPNTLTLGPAPGSGDPSRVFVFHQRASIFFFYEVTASGNISTNRDEVTFISESEVVDLVPGADMISGDVILFDITDPDNHVEVQRYPLK